MPKTIVWIEDDTDIIDPVVRPLELAGHRFVRLHSVGEALQALDQIRGADLILLDMLLPPGQNGREFGPYPGETLLRELRERHHVEVPVIVLSVVTNAEVRERVRALGAVDVIRKPIRPSELKERVEAVFDAEP